MSPTREPTNLIDTAPNEAVDLYLENRRGEVAKATLYAHNSRLNHFLRWCKLEGIENMNDLGPRDLQHYKIWRREDGNLATPSLKSQLSCIRVFIRYCERIEAVRPDLHMAVDLPSLAKGEGQRSILLPEGRAEAILTYLDRYEHASWMHIAIQLMWTTCARLGAVRAVDIQDYYSDEQYLEYIHRPQTDTPLKNGEEGERPVALDDATCNLLDDYIENKRFEVKDEHGREPLLTSRQGRRHESNIRDMVYRWTRPCAIGSECPADKDPDTCEWNEYGTASGCPESVSPHAIRRGAITRWLRDGVPPEAICDRANVSKRILDKHYNELTDEEAMELRRDWFEDG